MGRLSQIKNQTADVVSHTLQSRQYAGDRKNNDAQYNSNRGSVEASLTDKY